MPLIKHTPIGGSQISVNPPLNTYLGPFRLCLILEGWDYSHHLQLHIEHV